MSGHRHNKVTIAENAWLVISGISRHLSYQSSYKTVIQQVLMFQLPILVSLPTQLPFLVQQVTVHTPCSCPSWMSFISVIFQAQLGASCLAGCQRNQGSKCHVTAHRLYMVCSYTRFVSLLSAKGNYHNCREQLVIESYHAYNGGVYLLCSACLYTIFSACIYTQAELRQVPDTHPPAAYSEVAANRCCSLQCTRSNCLPACLL